jgi:hypothetical protein
MLHQRLQNGFLGGVHFRSAGLVECQKQWGQCMGTGIQSDPRLGASSDMQALEQLLP